MASSAKDIQLRELKDTISQLNTMMSEQTELIRSLRTIIEESPPVPEAPSHGQSLPQ